MTSRHRCVIEIKKSVITPALVQSMIPQSLVAISQETKNLNDYKMVVVGVGWWWGSSTVFSYILPSGAGLSSNFCFAVIVEGGQF